MKLVIFFFGVLALTSCMSMNIRKTDYPTYFTNKVQQYGYSVESYDVQTEDGYILELFRIPHGRSQQRSSKESSSSESSERQTNAIFLMHGMLSNSENFIYGGPNYGLAFYLADAGYDVFLGNARGSIYGQRHTTLNPQKDAAFWKFCWHQIGVKDLPALVDKALEVSGQNQISYVGFNEGSTSFYVLNSILPEYNTKFDRHISLGPLAYMKNSDNEVIQNIQSHMKSKPWIMKNMGKNSFTPSKELVQSAQEHCISQKYDQIICQNGYFLVNGYNSKNFNMTTVNEFIDRVPSSASVRELIHFVQLKSSGGFQSYTDESNQDRVQDYDLTKITVPMAFFYTPNDKLANVQDVNYLIGKIPHVYQQQNFQQLSNHLDLLYSQNTGEVYEKISKALTANTEQINEL